MDDDSDDQVSFVTVSDSGCTIKGSIPSEIHNFADTIHTTTTKLESQGNYFINLQTTRSNIPASRWSKMFEGSSKDMVEENVIIGSNTSQNQGVNRIAVGPSSLINQFNSKPLNGANFNVTELQDIPRTHSNESQHFHTTARDKPSITNQNDTEELANGPEHLQDPVIHPMDMPNQKWWSLNSFFSWNAKVNAQTSDEIDKRSTITSNRLSIRDTLFKSLKLEQPILPKLKEIVKVGPKLTRKASLTNLLDLYDYPVTESALLEDEVFSPKSHRQHFKDLEKIEEVNNEDDGEKKTFSGLNELNQPVKFINFYFKRKLQHDKETEKQNIPPSKILLNISDHNPAKQDQDKVATVSKSRDPSSTKMIKLIKSMKSLPNFHKHSKEENNETKINKESHIDEDNAIRKVSSAPSLPNDDNQNIASTLQLTNNTYLSHLSEFKRTSSSSVSPLKRKLEEPDKRTVTKKANQDRLKELAILISQFDQSEDISEHERKKAIILQKLGELRIEDDDYKIKQLDVVDNDHASIDLKRALKMPRTRRSTIYHNSHPDHGEWKDQNEIHSILNDFLEPISDLSSEVSPKVAKNENSSGEEDNEDIHQGLVSHIDYLASFITANDPIMKTSASSTSTLDFFSAQ